VSDGFRDTLITTSSRLVSAMVRAAFLFPSTWVLERVIHRLRPHPGHSPLLALQIIVIWVYVFGAADLLERFGYLREGNALGKAVKLASGLTMVALVPLLLVWAVVAFRQRRR
jgi:hypothetical protein